MKAIKIIFILSLITTLSKTQTIFCFPLCSNCDGPDYNQCKGANCRPGINFVKGPPNGPDYSCIKTPYTYYSTGAKW